MAALPSEGWPASVTPRQTLEASRARTIAAALDALRPEPHVDWRIHVVGADHREGSTPEANLLAFDALFGWAEARAEAAATSNAHPTVELSLIGPNVPAQLHGSDLRFSRAGEKSYVGLTGEGGKGCKIRLRHSAQLYHEVALDGVGDATPAAAAFAKPDLVVCFNASVWGYDSWLGTLQFALAHADCPVLITSYNALEGGYDYDALSDGLDSATFRWVWEPALNPWRSLERRPSAVTEKEMHENHTWQCLAGVRGISTDGGSGGEDRICFVTVGTTSFDELVRQMDSPAIHEHLRRLGMTKLVVQVGRGVYTPKCACAAAEDGAGASCGVEFLPTIFFRFAPSLDAHMRSAALVISHGGAGSIMEALGLRKPLVVVVNGALMDDHQTELAGALEERGHLRSTTCSGLESALGGFKLTGGVSYPAPDLDAFPKVVDGEMGFGPARVGDEAGD